MEHRLDLAIARVHPLYADVMCLDFANTLEPRGGPPPIELPRGITLRDGLDSFDDLVAWVHRAGGYDRDVALALLAEADRSPDAADAVLRDAHTSRDVIYRIFWAIAEDNQPDAADLAALQAVYADAVWRASLAFEATWTWRDTGHDLARPLRPVARSAMELLTHGRTDRIKVCPGAGIPPVHCAWLFLDTTKNGSRRWCSMADCGAAEKARQQTARRREARRRADQ